MLGDLIDNLISIASPKWGASRVAHRAYISQVRAASGRHAALEKMLGTNQKGGYEAGKADRLKGRHVGSAHENDQDRAQIIRMRWRAWNLFRNNPQARKITRTLGAKVIGRGMSPQPQATMPDGKPHVEFRKRARQVWDEFIKESDFRGKPGSGGQHLTAQAKTALRGTCLSGGVLYQFHHLDRAEAKHRGLYVPLLVQLLHVDRLDETLNNDSTFHGVELDGKGRVAAYHILKGGTLQGEAEKPVRIPVKAMRHLYSEDDIDQILGASWFSAALLTMDDRRQYEYSELIAAEMGSCFVGAYSLSPGQSYGPSLNNDGSRDLTDAQGNPVNHLQPGMMINTGRDGKFEILSPNRPNSGAEGFISHLVRSEAVSMPGVKSSTLTGDYRQSSFSSERSADNDIWPEIYEIQDWFAIGFYQPIWEECIRQAIAAGLFDSVQGFSVEDFNSRSREYLKANWQGPVPLSINPKDDADAARQRVKNCQSTPQREAAKEATDWRENVNAVAEFIDYCKERKVPDDIWQQALGIEQKDQPATAAAPRPTEQQQDDQMAANRLRQTGFVSMNRAGAT